MPNSSCTTILVTPSASADGRMRVAHSCDDALADHRFVYVPAQDWPEGARRPVYPCGICEKELPQWNARIIPRLYVPGRPDAYRDPLGQAYPTLPVGSIPQVRHTFAYLDSNYGVMNEAGLVFGECTCRAHHLCPPEEGKRIFYSSELMRVALERCTAALEAVELMGSLIEEYGVYGTGETLLVADAKDAWVMEMAPSSQGTGGLWAARRVPDGEIFVEANLFRLRKMDPTSPDQRLCSTLRAMAQEGQEVDWAALTSEGEFHHPYYAMRRVWRVMDLLAPSLQAPTKLTGFLDDAYPFSFAPDRPVNLQDLFRIYRDHLEGTPFDLTKGVAAGPWGNPNRPRPTEEEATQGAWERPISMVDTGYAYILEPRGICWLALGRPAEVPFVPLAVAPPPAPFSQGSPREFDPEGSAWWRYNLVSQFSELRYCDMRQDIARAQQRAEERAMLALEAPELPDANALNRLAETTLQEWKELFAHMAVTYNQGYYNTPEKFSQKRPSNPQYLQGTEFPQGPLHY